MVHQWPMEAGNIKSPMGSAFRASIGHSTTCLFLIFFAPKCVGDNSTSPFYLHPLKALTHPTLNQVLARTDCLYFTFSSFKWLVHFSHQKLDTPGTKTKTRNLLLEIHRPYQAHLNGTLRCLFVTARLLIGTWGEIPPCWSIWTVFL